MIPQSLWDQVQDILGRSLAPTRSIKRTHPLTGLLKCPQCGHGMIPSHASFTRKNGNSKTYFYYACGSHGNKGSSVCKPNFIPADKIEHGLQGNWNQKSSKERKPQLEDLNRLETDLLSFEVQQKKCFQLYEEGTLSKDILVVRLKEIKSLRESTISSIHVLQQTIDDNKIESVSLQKVRQALSQLWTVMGTANEQQQRQLLKLMIDKITIPYDRDIGKATIHTTAALMHLQFSSK